MLPGHPLFLRVAGEAEAARSAHVIVRAGDRTIVDQTIGTTFAFSAAIPADVLGLGIEAQPGLKVNYWKTASSLCPSGSRTKAA